MAKSETLKSLFENGKKFESLEDATLPESGFSKKEDDGSAPTYQMKQGKVSTTPPDEPKLPKARRRRRAARDEAAYAKILTSCASIANDRQKNYGDAKKNFQETSELCAKMFGLEISPTAIVKVMIAVKWARQMHRQKQDNLIDAVNYTAILAHMTEEESR